MTPMRANIVGPPDVATRISASMAACHSAASCSAFGSLVIYLPASSRVTSWPPRGNRIGSSNRRCQPRLLMAPALLVELDFRALRHPRRHIVVNRVALRTRSSGRAHSCRRARLPTVGQGDSHTPNRSPHKGRISFQRRIPSAA